MHARRRAPAVLVSMLLFLLAACGGSPPPTQTPYIIVVTAPPGTGVSGGVASPTPEFTPLREKMSVVTPMTSPFAFSSGPPELPGLMAASV